MFCGAACNCRNNWLTAKEMLAYGLVDKVLDKLPAKPEGAAKKSDE